MHHIYNCVDAFSNLLDVEYHLVLGKKGIATELQIAFDKRDCFHLMGLQYLKDRPNLNKDREKIFDSIMERNSFSKIEADYLMRNQIENQRIFIFLSQNRDEKYFCRSFFPQERFDYSKNQPLWTLLYKKKVRITTGEEIILYNRMS